MSDRPLSQLLAEDLGLMQQDVIAHVVHRFGLPHGLTDTEIIDVVRGDLDSLCERSVPEYWWPSEHADPGICRCRALGGLEHAPGPECPLPPQR